MEIQADDVFDLNECEIQNVVKGISEMGTKATVNTDILYNFVLMEENERDVPCPSAVRNEGAGLVPVADGVHSSEDDYNAGIVWHNNQGNFQGQMQGSFYEQMQGNFQGQIQGNFQGQMQGNFQGQMQGNFQGQMQGNFQGQMQGNFHGQMQGNFQGQMQGNFQGQMQGNFQGQMQGSFYEQMQPIPCEQLTADFHNLTINRYPFQPQEEFVNPQQDNNNFGCYGEPHQPVYPGKGHYGEASHSVQQYNVSAYAAPVDPNTYQPPEVDQQFEEPILSPVQPTPQLDVSRLEIKKLHQPARYRKKTESLNEATPIRRQYRSRNLYGRRERGKAGTTQDSVKRHRQSIEDYLEFGRNNIENLEKMNLAVIQANDELKRMLYVLQKMIDY